MSNKINQRVTLGVITALLMSGAFMTNAIAAECGQAKLIEAGSVGVYVNKNTCENKSRISVGSVVELAAGSRMWLKFDPNATGESFQLICQNKSADAVNVNIAGVAAPWIAPQGLKSCGKWAGKKLSCDDNNGEKNSFFCAIASDKVTHVAGTPTIEQTTSVKLRGFPKPISVEDIIKNISPDIQLCKDLYGLTTKLEMSWNISTSGMIKDLQVNSDNKDLVSCVESVAKQANANQELTIKHEF